MSLRLLDVRPGGGGHLPPAAIAGPAVVPNDQPESLERLKFPQDGSLTRAVSGINRQVDPLGIAVTVVSRWLHGELRRDAGGPWELLTNESRCEHLGGLTYGL